MEEARDYEPHVAEDAQQLRRLIELQNQGCSRDNRITQERIAKALGMTQGNVSSTMRGRRRLSQNFIVGLYQHFGLHVRDYSPTTFEELKVLAPLFATAASTTAIPSHMQHAWEALNQSLNALKSAQLEHVGKAIKAVEAHQQVLGIYFQHASEELNQ